MQKKDKRQKKVTQTRTKFSCHSFDNVIYELYSNLNWKVNIMKKGQMTNIKVTHTATQFSCHSFDNVIHDQYSNFYWNFMKKKRSY